MDKQFLHLNDRWVLAADDRQWILQRRGAFDRRRGKIHWHCVAFIASRRDVLLRMLRFHNVEPDAAGQQALAELPDTFTEWRASRSEGPDAAMSGPEASRSPQRRLRALAAGLKRAS